MKKLLLLLLLLNIFFTGCTASSEKISTDVISDTVLSNITTKNNDEADTIFTNLYDKEVLTYFINFVLNDVGDNFDVVMQFYDIDCDKDIEMIYTCINRSNNTHRASLYEFDKLEKTVYEASDFHYGTTAEFNYGKCRNKHGDEFFIMFDGENISYKMCNNILSETDNLFFCAIYDNRTNDKLIPFWQVNDYVTQCTDLYIHYIDLPSVPFDCLVEENEFYKAKESFEKSISFIPVEIKQVGLTSTQLENISADEVYDMCVETYLLMDFPK